MGSSRVRSCAEAVLRLRLFTALGCSRADGVRDLGDSRWDGLRRGIAMRFSG